MLNIVSTIQFTQEILIHRDTYLFILVFNIKIVVILLVIIRICSRNMSMASVLKLYKIWENTIYWEMIDRISYIFCLFEFSLVYLSFFLPPFYSIPVLCYWFHWNVLHKLAEKNWKYSIITSITVEEIPKFGRENRRW